MEGKFKFHCHRIHNGSILIVNEGRERLATARVKALPAVWLLLPGPQKRATGEYLQLDKTMDETKATCRLS